MSKIDRIDADQPGESPLELVQRFSRTKNYPRDQVELMLFAQALARVSRDTGIPMGEIVENCLVDAEWCPTDRDLLQVAREMQSVAKRAAESSRDQRAEWEKQYGPPDPEWSDRLIRKAGGKSAGKSVIFAAELEELKRTAIHDSIWYTEGKGRARLDSMNRKDGDRDRAFWQAAVIRNQREHPQGFAAIREQTRIEGEL